jgi:hypothetical protein
MFVWVMRDKGSEWRALRSQNLKSLGCRLLIEAVREPLIPGNDGKVKSFTAMTGHSERKVASDRSILGASGWM